MARRIAYGTCAAGVGPSGLGNACLENNDYIPGSLEL